MFSYNILFFSDANNWKKNLYRISLGISFLRVRAQLEFRFQIEKREIYILQLRV